MYVVTTSNLALRLLTNTSYSTFDFLQVRHTHPIRLRIRGYNTTKMELQTLAIKENGVPHQFVLSFQGWKFFFGSFLKLVIFMASERESAPVKFIHTNASRKKTFLFKKMIRSSHA